MRYDVGLREGLLFGGRNYGILMGKFSEEGKVDDVRGRGKIC